MPIAKKIKRYRLLIIFCTYLLLFAQKSYSQDKNTIYYSVDIQKNDTTINVYLPQVVIFNPLVFKSEKDKQEYNKLIRDVKRTLPYAKDVAKSIIETYEFMETLPDKKSKQKHLEEVQKEIMKEYKPKMKKLTKNQGKILIKLIDRQCNSTSYDIIKSLVGSFKAGLYNAFASAFGNSLKSEYAPEGKDKMIERIVILIEQGVL